MNCSTSSTVKKWRATSMVEVRERSNGAPPLSVIDAGAGTSCGAAATGRGAVLGAAVGWQAAPAKVAVSATRRRDPIRCMTPVSLAKVFLGEPPRAMPPEPEANYALDGPFR